MTRARALSPAARQIIDLLDAAGAIWSHGYELSRASGIKSGTLYPLLIRLEAQGLLAAEWQAASEPGRPPRHAYRLTEAGRVLARQLGAASCASPRALPA